MTNGRVEVITSVERRRWSSAEKEQLVGASLEPSGRLPEKAGFMQASYMAGAISTSGRISGGGALDFSGGGKLTDTMRAENARLA